MIESQNLKFLSPRNVFEQIYKNVYLTCEFASKNSVFCYDFHKIVVKRSQLCRTALIRSSLGSSDLCASDGVPNFSFRRFGADEMVFKIGQNLESRISDEIRDSTGRSSKDFKSRHVSPKGSKNKAWPTIRCAKVESFQKVELISPDKLSTEWKHFYEIQTLYWEFQTLFEIL